MIDLGNIDHERVAPNASHGERDRNEVSEVDTLRLG